MKACDRARNVKFLGNNFGCVLSKLSNKNEYPPTTTVPAIVPTVLARVTLAAQCATKFYYAVRLRSHLYSLLAIGGLWQSGGQIASQAGMPLPTAVPGIPMTSAWDIPGIPGGNSSTAPLCYLRQKRKICWMISPFILKRTTTNILQYTNTTRTFSHMAIFYMDVISKNRSGIPN